MWVDSKGVDRTSLRHGFNPRAENSDWSSHSAAAITQDSTAPGLLELVPSIRRFAFGQHGRLFTLKRINLRLKRVSTNVILLF